MSLARCCSVPTTILAEISRELTITPPPVAALLSSAEWLFKENLERSAIFAFFDAEEPPNFLTPRMGSIRFYEDQRAGYIRILGGPGCVRGNVSWFQLLCLALERPEVIDKRSCVLVYWEFKSHCDYCGGLGVVCAAKSPGGLLTLPALRDFLGVATP